MSRTGYTITCAGFLILLCSKIQIGIAFSTKYTEHIALIWAMRYIIPFMELMKEVSFIFDINLPKSEVFYKVFEANQSCIAIAESNKFSLRKKHTLLLIIITYKALYIRKLFGYVTLILANKQQKCLLSHLKIIFNFF